MENTPVLLLVFNRPDLTSQLFYVIKSIKPAKLYIVSDGPRENIFGEVEACQKVREIFDNIDWECEVHKLYRAKNIGCDSSIIEGISWFFKHEEQGIILEDDCIPTKSFFEFCEKLLNKYKEDSTISFISGSTLYNKALSKDVNYYIGDIMFLWGWATWRRVWVEIDWKKKYEIMEVRGRMKEMYNSNEYIEMVCNNISSSHDKHIAYWDTHFFLHTIFKNKAGIIPALNQISNIGNSGTHYLKSKSDLFNCKRHEIKFQSNFFDKYQVMSVKLKNKIIKNYLYKINKLSFKDRFYLWRKKIKNVLKINQMSV